MLQGNLFVLGYTKSGKTNIARQFVEQLEFIHVSASAWVREEFSRLQTPGIRSDTFVKKITEYSVKRLREDPDVCIRSIQNKFSLPLGGHIIEGIRNPRDFISLFHPTHDAVVYLCNDVQPKPLTPFETGVSVIVQYLDWLAKSGLAEKRFLQCHLKNYENIPDAVKECVSFVKNL